MRLAFRAFIAPFRYVFALLFPRLAFRRLYAELARLDYVNDWREFYTLSGRLVGITSSMGGPKIRAAGINPFFFRQRERGTPAERLVIETVDGETWTDWNLTEGAVRAERRLLAELYAHTPCVASDEQNVIPRVVK
jgi:hypothetical protein